MAKTIFILAGGTGGHVYPALAVAMQLRAQGFEPVWLGTTQGLEAKVVPNEGIKFEAINISGLRGKKFAKIFNLPLQLFSAIRQSMKLIKQHKPVLVIGFGGYVAGPGCIAAVLKKIPLVLHEQNTRPGMTNKYMAKFAKKVCSSFPNSFPGKNVIITGNPVREDILAINKVKAAEQDKPLKILVLGGSQGAQAINAIMPEVIAKLPEPVKVWHQAGLKNFKQTSKLYQDLNITVRVVPFIKTMSKAYEWADLVIARAGATTVAELAIARCPSILIPYPHATDDHQTTNAKYLANQHGAVIMPQVTLQVSDLTEKISSFLKNRTYLSEMTENLTSLGMRNATRDIVKICLENAK